MDFKFGNDSSGSQQNEVPGEKKNQSALLVLLLILIGGFTYVYFFTALIKPLDAEKKGEATATAQNIVKIPLPPREGGPAKPEEKVSGKTEPIKAAAPATAAAVPAAKPAVVAAKPAPLPAAKSAPAPAKLKDEPKKAEAPKSAEKKPVSAAVADKNSAKVPTANVADKKPAVVDKMSATVKETKTKPASDKQAKSESAVKPQKTATGLWSLIVGNYVLEETLSADMGRVRKAGFEPVINSSERKKTAMNRLFVSESIDRNTALSTLEKLKRHTSDAFVIEQGGKFHVYAGSYSQNEAVNSEKERLKAAGFPVTVKRTDISIPSHNLSVGPFNSKKEAEAALGKLKSAGIKASLSQK
ncbi:MAG: SPOR domain-containing protein [Geobacteraceae bacterium]|nr:SPOR domain-containing protein [Geobacteraceae bacterium]NTW79156.1 SPOR domain-containing protein [Geobacteraceae bacterium]